jgi:putative ABC transport system permease protein
MLKPGDALLLGARGAFAHPLRAALSLLGLVIGVGAIVGVLAVLRGMDSFLVERFAQVGPHALLLELDAPLRDGRLSDRLRPADARALQSCFSIAEAACESRTYGAVACEGRVVASAEISGIEAAWLLLTPCAVAAGRVPSEAELASGAELCFLGHDLAEALFPGGEAVGGRVAIGGRLFSVVGVAAPRGAVFGFSQDTYARIALRSFENLFGATTPLRIAARVHSNATLAEAEEEVRERLRSERLGDPRFAGALRVVTAEGAKLVWARITTALERLSIALVSISLLVGTLVIGNALLISVVSRRREIALAKALGAREGEIALQFLCESCGLCAVGGLCGLALAAAIAVAVRRWAEIPAEITPGAALLGLAIALLVGLLSGVYPAWRAARVDPARWLQGA